MKKKYTLRILDLAVYLLVGLLVVGCHKEKEDITDEEQIRVVMENAEVVMDDVSKIYEVSGTVEEMAQHLDEIKAMPNVEDAYQDGISICVKIKDGGIIMWCYFPEEEDYKRMDVDMLFNSLPNNNFQNKQADKSNALCEEKSVCILQVLNEPLDLELERFKKIGYSTYEVVSEEVTPEVLVSSMQNYGITIIATDGFYSEKTNNHWLVTGVLYTPSISDWAFKLWREDQNRYVCKGEVSSHLCVSEDYLDNYFTDNNVRFHNNSVLILDACEGLMVNDSFWQKLKKHGLGCLLGFDRSIWTGESNRCMRALLNEMLIYGATASEACLVANETLNPHYNPFTPLLLCRPETSNIVFVEHKFSVGQDSYVEFAPGNLADGGRSFVSNQWEYGGHFGWGTGVNPNNHSIEASDYSGPFEDWGKYIPGGWRTITKDEWEYLRARTDNYSLLMFCTGHIKDINGNDVNGLILFPDNWLEPEGVSVSTRGVCGWTPNYSEHWENMERAGAVFLPAAGGRIGENVYFQNQHGFYWTSTPVYRIAIYDDSIATHGPFPRFYGQSVRLVRDRND